MKTWEIKRAQFKVTDFISWQKSGGLNLSPIFQRRAVWKPDAKSYLMDTVVRGLPMPIIFLREQRSDPKVFEPRREVVDGQQRLRTILSYVSSSLLSDYRPDRDDFTVKMIHNADLGGRTFSELDPDFQQQILDYEFSVHVIPVQVDDREILEIFRRMNSTAVKLNEQELRNAQWYGEFKTSAYLLAEEQLSRWRAWAIFNEDDIARMEEVELVSEFMILMIRGLTGKTQRALDRVYEEKDEVYPERQEVERRFQTIMDTIDDKLGSNLRTIAFRRKTLFFHLFAFLYDVQYGIGSSLLSSIRAKPVTPNHIKAIKLAGDRVKSRSAPEAVLEASARRTTHQISRQAFLEYLKSLS